MPTFSNNAVYFATTGSTPLYRPHTPPGPPPPAYMPYHAPSSGAVVTPGIPQPGPGAEPRPEEEPKTEWASGADNCQEKKVAVKQEPGLEEQPAPVVHQADRSHLDRKCKTNGALLAAMIEWEGRKLDEWLEKEKKYPHPAYGSQKYPLEQKVQKYFLNDDGTETLYKGYVTGYDEENGWYRVLYVDGDRADYNEAEMDDIAIRKQPKLHHFRKQKEVEKQ